MAGSPASACCCSRCRSLLRSHAAAAKSLARSILRVCRTPRAVHSAPCRSLPSAAAFSPPCFFSSHAGQYSLRLPHLCSHVRLFAARSPTPDGCACGVACVDDSGGWRARCRLHSNLYGRMQRWRTEAVEDYDGRRQVNTPSADLLHARTRMEFVRVRSGSCVLRRRGAMHCSTRCCPGSRRSTRAPGPRTVAPRL